MARKFTAEEMRQMAGLIEYERSVQYSPDVEEITAMLRQSADMMDREGESDVIQCRKCQTERSGEGYGDVPPPIGEDDICDRCKISERLRHNRDSENQMESEKKYEYAAKWPDGYICSPSDNMQVQTEFIRIAGYGLNLKLVRREVAGEWEVVDDVQQ